MKKIVPGNLVKLKSFNKSEPISYNVRNFFDWNDFGAFTTMFSEYGPECYYSDDIPLLYLGHKTYVDYTGKFNHYNFLWLDKFVYKPIIAYREYSDILDCLFEKISP